MYCTSCGKEIPEGKKFCPQCGVPLGAKVVMKYEETQKMDISPDGENGHRPEEEGPGETIKRKRIVVGGVIIALFVLLGAGVIYYSGTTGESSDSSPAISSASYGRSKTVRIAPDAKIALYGKDGEKLKDYDLSVTDSDGVTTTYHVDGDEFSPTQLGLTSGGYTISTKDPSTNANLKADVSVTNDGNMNVEFKPSDEDDTKADDWKSDGTKDKGDNKGKLSVSEKYKLYLDKVEELEKKYGKARYFEMSSGDDWRAASCDGVGFIDLADLDGDGFEELVVAHPMDAKDIVSDDYANMMDGQYYLKTIEVWTVDGSQLKQMGCFNVYPTVEGASYLYVLDGIDKRPTTMLLAQSMYMADDIRTFENFVVTADKEGKLAATVFTTMTPLASADGGQSSTCSVNGEEISQEEEPDKWNEVTGLGYSSGLGAGKYFRLNGTEYDSADESNGQADNEKTYSIKETVEFANQQRDRLESKAKGK